MSGRTLLVSCCLMLTAASASAQSAVGARGYFTYGAVIFSASETLDAVAGKHHAPSIGGGGSVTGLWRGLFVDVALSQQTLDGERVFVAGRRGISAGYSAQGQVPSARRGRRLAHDPAALLAIRGSRTLANRLRGDERLLGSGGQRERGRNGALVMGGVDVPGLALGARRRRSALSVGQRDSRRGRRVRRVRRGPTGRHLGRGRGFGRSVASC